MSRLNYWLLTLNIWSHLSVVIPERVLYGKGVVSVGIVTIIVALSAVLGESDNLRWGKMHWNWTTYILYHFRQHSNNANI